MVQCESHYGERELFSATKDETVLQNHEGLCYNSSNETFQRFYTVFSPTDTFRTFQPVLRLDDYKAYRPMGVQPAQQLVSQPGGQGNSVSMETSGNKDRNGKFQGDLPQVNTLQNGPDSGGKWLSSTPLEILFFLNGWYYATYFLLELFIFLYKALTSVLAGLLLPYPTANLVLDVAILFLYLGIEVIRLFVGTNGNLCQRKMPLGISVALTFPSTMMASYYLLLQTYMLRLEAIMNNILLFFCGSELLLEVLPLAAFSSMDRI
ncbi:transmembrane protein 216-like [Kogia breviceps]|uniref:transmembrane protein 216-like n=1 Tax=Kogia breviceps TaxID=27615 RepID=UPI00279637C5|nr:transmembrane protein 216-like [Kogia breviceps]